MNIVEKDRIGAKLRYAVRITAQRDALRAACEEFMKFANKDLPKGFHPPEKWFDELKAKTSIIEAAIIAMIPTGPHAEANARLIASAPETAKQRDALLAALKKYGKHDKSCIGMKYYKDRDAVIAESTSCTCGFEAAIEAAGEK